MILLLAMTGCPEPRLVMVPAVAVGSDSVADSGERDSAVDSGEDSADTQDSSAGGPTLSGARFRADAGAWLLGAERGSHAGSTLLRADLQGDGVVDVLVGGKASGLGDLGAQPGEAAWVAGPVVAGDSSLADASARLLGNTSHPGAFAGAALEVWDPEGDGQGLFLVGQPGGGSGGEGPGVVLLLSPSNLGPEVLADAVLSGRTPSGGAGYSLAVGDGDGDGLDELAVGAPQFWEDSLFVVGASAAGGGALADHASVVLSEKSVRFGGALSYADFDGDGLEDLAVGAEHDREGFGEVAVFRGGAVTTGLADAGLRVQGDESAHLGWGIGAVDLDGDGRPELMVSGRELWVLPASADGVFGVEDATLNLAVGGTSFAAGDLDGDGVQDLVWAESTANMGAGVVRVHHGPLSGRVISGGEEDATIFGVIGDMAGASLAIADADADGVADLLVGVTGDDAAGEEAGAVWVFAGGTSP